MKKRIVSFFLVVTLTASLFFTLGIPAGAYSTDYPNTHTNTGDQRADIVQIAETQVGYPENDGTKYGAWWQELQNTTYDFTHEAWCVMFVHWCLNQAGLHRRLQRPERPQLCPP